MIDEARPKTPIEALQRFFRYPEFRPGQEEIIRSALAGRDTMVVMPTGGGKSLCYQVPALLMDGITLVVSPLIALMKDQVDALARCGVRATTINSMLDFSTVRQRMTDIRYGLYRLVYVAPERFESPSFLELVREIQIGLFAVDEAHCISEWGHDFRPSYLKLRTAAEDLGRPPIIALTATATPFVQEDIIRQLGLQEPRRFVRGFDRPNLTYNARASVDKEQDLREMMQHEMTRDGSVVIYCGTRRNVESVGTMLHAERLPVTIYHAGMRDGDRRTAQEMFINGKTKAIIATNAFGMGIDKSDVRHVIHFDMPGSIEAYYQEAGRAGRDGLPSDCTLLHNARDRKLQEFFIRSTYPERDQLEALYEAMWDSLHVGVGNRYEGVFVPDMKDLAARSRLPAAALSNVLAVLEKNEILKKVKSERLAMVRFLSTSTQVQEYYQRTRDPDRQKTIMALLRTLGGAALAQQTLFNPDDMTAKYGLTPEAFDRSMRSLMMGGLLVYTPATPGTGYQFLQERMALRRLPLDERSIEQGRGRALQKLDAMERYVRSAACRRDFILEYFCAEPEPGPCGHCDVCAKPVERNGNTVGTISARDTVTGLSRVQATRAIEQLLASVEELGGRFGRMTIVDILRGARTATIDRFGLERYHRFGELREIDRGELARITDALIEDRLMETSAALRPTVRLTSDGRHAIRHLTLRTFVPEWEDSERCRNPELLRDLREVRDRIATRDTVTTASVCPDELLLRISNTLPFSRQAFMAIAGMTAAIYERCGSAFLALIEALLGDDEGTIERSDLPERLRRTYLLLMEGCTLQEIAYRSALQPSTISGHIDDLLKLGIVIDINRFVPPGIIRAVREQMTLMPTASIRELKALLGGAVDYPELRIATSWIRAGNGKLPGAPQPAGSMSQHGA